MPLSSSILSALQNQFIIETHNFHRYITRAAWADYYGLTGIRDFFQNQAKEELEHAHVVYSFIIDRGERIATALPMLDEPVPDTIIGVFETALKIEIDTTASLNAIYALAHSEQDYITAGWILETLIKNQREEEDTFLTILDRIKVRFGMTGLAGGGEINPACDDGAAIHDMDTWIAGEYNA